MGLAAMMNRVDKFGFWDVAFDELAVLAFTLLVVKYWPAATSLSWYWYAIVGALAASVPLKTLFKK